MKRILQGLIIQKMAFLAISFILPQYISAQNLVISSSNNGSTICSGDQVTFTATVSNIPTLPCQNFISSSTSYSWFIERPSDGSVIGVYTDATQNRFTSSPSNYPLRDNDRVYCIMNYVYICNIPGAQVLNATSNKITVNVIQNQSYLFATGDVTPVTNTDVVYTTNLQPGISYEWTVLNSNFGSISSGQGTGSIQIHTSNVSNQSSIIKVRSYPTACTSESSKSQPFFLSATSQNTPPAAPTNFKVSGFNNADVTFTWDASNDNIGIQSYQIFYKDERLTSAAVDFITVDGTITTATVSNLIEAVPYKFYIVALDNDNTYSTGGNVALADNSVSSTTFIYDKTPPSIPQNLTSIEETNHTVTLVWNSSTDNVQTTGYDIYKDAILVASNVPLAPYTASITTLPTIFSLKARDAKGNLSEMSDTLAVIRKVDPFVIDNATGNVGLSVRPPSQKLDVDGTIKARGDLITNPLTISGVVETGATRLNYGGTSLDFFTPVQAQWNGNKPVMSMSQYGEINFFSTPHLNYNDIRLLGTNNASNGLGYRDNYGTASGIGGPVLYGNDGGALGTKQNPWNGPEQVALTWNRQGDVAVTGRISSKGGLQFNDGTILNSTNGLLRNGQSNVEFGENVEIIGDNPYLRIGSLVMQDFTTFQYINNQESSTGITRLNIIKPEAFVFGNIYFDEALQKYTSIYARDNGTFYEKRTGIFYDISTKNGGTGIRFNSDAGKIEFITIPSATGVNTPETGWSVTKNELLNYQRLVINTNGGVGIGVSDPQEKLEVDGNIRIVGNNKGIMFADGTVLTTVGFIWRPSTQNSDIYFNGGAVGIGTTVPSTSLIPNLKLNINGSTLVRNSLFLGAVSQLGSINYDNNGFHFRASTDDKELFGIKNNGFMIVNGKIDATEFHSCISPGTCPDYVFEQDYALMDLKSLEQFIKLNKHLPEVPSAIIVEKEGLNMKEMNLILLKKVEELTLYVLQLHKEIESKK